MTSPPLRRGFLLSHGLVAAVVAITAFVVARGLRDETRTPNVDLVALALNLASRVDGDIAPDPLEHLVSEFRAGSHRVTVYALDGRVLADSHRDPAVGPRSFKELAEVRDGRVVSGRTRGRAGAAFAAVPILADGRPVAVLRVSRSSSTSTGGTRRWGPLAAIAVVVAVGVGVIGSRRLGSALSSLRASVDRMSDGDTEHRATAGGAREIDALSDALNRSTRRWEERVEAERRRNEEQAAILTSVREAVIAVDMDERVLLLNRGAGDLLGVDVDASVGRSVHEVFRDIDVQRFIRHTLEATGPVSAEFALGGARAGCVLRGSGVRLRSTAGDLRGAVIVLEDVTRSKRLERLRQEFVANVSHELRTPLTAIKGSLETLRDIVTTPDAERFADMAIRQANRLHAIVEDLLTLSRIERRADDAGADFSSGPLRPSLEAAVALCAPKAGERRVGVDITGEADVSVRRNPRLLEQAIVNLLDNAIQYSPEGGRVRLSVTREPDAVRIDVTDDGVGIPPEHHARLFERFFTVDRARSRQAGGTGLGLAIVKHIVLAHGGTVGVHSEVRHGSTFWVRLPHPEAKPAS